MLHKYSISLDFSDPASIISLKSIIREFEKLDKTHDLFFARQNNTIAKPFFVPSRIKSAERFNDWERSVSGFQSILEFMSNGMDDVTTHKPVAVLHLMKLLSTAYPNSFAHHTKLKGIKTIERMSVIETATVLSDIGVGDKKVLGTLQKHLKTKYNGHFLSYS